MKLPSMTYSNGMSSATQTAFAGLNHTPGAGDGELYHMENLTGADYPLLSSRPPRWKVRTLTHTTAGHKLTVSEMPSHRHREDTSAIRWSSPNGNCELVYQGNDVGSGGYGGGTKYTRYTGSGASHSHGNTGSALSNTTNNNMPAYFTVYCWYRTA